MCKGIILLAAGVLLVGQANAFSLGSVEIAGNSCEAPVGAHSVAEISEGRFIIPTSLYVKKEEDKRIARGSCNFALILQAQAGKKIVVSNSHQLTSLRAYPSQTKVRIDLEIFEAGSQGAKQSLEADAVDQTSKLTQSLEQSEILIETACSGSTILRGNLAATLIGAGKARAFARDLYIDIAEVDCQ